MPSQLRGLPRPIPIGPRLDINGDRPGFEKQENFKWCWAACVRMILKHYNASPDTQCEVAQKGLGFIGVNSVCCSSPGSIFNDNEGCIELLPDEQITHLWEAYPNLLVHHTDGRIDDEAIKEELRAKHQVEIGYEQNVSGHVVIAYGWTIDPTNNRLFFLLHDPKSNPDAMVSPSALNEGGRGLWNATWVIRKRLPGE
jgi:hypothetical protein